jgi:glycerol kinase
MTLRVDGGMVANDLMLQMLADALDAPVERPQNLETTAMGVAWLAGSAAGVLPGQAEFAGTWAANKCFQPKTDAALRESAYARWKHAVAAVIGYARSQTAVQS